MNKHLIFILLSIAMIAMLPGCKSDEDKIREAAEEYLYKNMKNPESLKILSCEIRQDTIPFWLNEELFDMAKTLNDAIEKFDRYKNMSYLFIEEKLESIVELQKQRELFKSAYENHQANDSTQIEYIAYVKSSGSNVMGGIVSSSTIIIFDKNEPTKLLGSYVVNKDFIEKYVVIKMGGNNFDYEFKKNKFGKYETDHLPYIEQFIMNDAD